MVLQGPSAVELASLINGNDQNHRHDNEDYDGGDGNDAASKGGAAVAASPSAAALSKRRLRLLLLLAFGLSIVVTTKLFVGTSSTFNMQANEPRSRGNIGGEGSKIILDDDDDDDYISWAHTNLRWQPAMTSTAIDADNDNNNNCKDSITMPSRLRRKVIMVPTVVHRTSSSGTESLITLVTFNY